MKHILLLATLLLSLGTFSQSMDNDRLQQILSQESDSIIGLSGRWQVTYKELPMLVITDETNDRMRIMTPITETSQLDKELLSVCLEANYHSVLDAKYAIADEILWSVYIHPLSPLTEAQIRSALSQVYYAAVTFGSSFSSTELIFGGGRNEEETPKKKLKKMGP